jgi:hypothetical protein
MNTEDIEDVKIKHIKHKIFYTFKTYIKMLLYMIKYK